MPIMYVRILTPVEADGLHYMMRHEVGRVSQRAHLVACLRSIRPYRNEHSSLPTAVQRSAAGFAASRPLVSTACAMCPVPNDRAKAQLLLTPSCKSPSAMRPTTSTPPFLRPVGPARCWAPSSPNSSTSHSVAADSHDAQPIRPPLGQPTSLHAVDRRST